MLSYYNKIPKKLLFNHVWKVLFGIFIFKFIYTFKTYSSNVIILTA